MVKDMRGNTLRVGDVAVHHAKYSTSVGVQLGHVYEIGKDDRAGYIKLFRHWATHSREPYVITPWIRASNLLKV